jgi:hypothetical protein
LDFAVTATRERSEPRGRGPLRGPGVPGLGQRDHVVDVESDW